MSHAGARTNSCEPLRFKLCMIVYIHKHTMSSQQRNTSACKRTGLDDITNTYDTIYKRCNVESLFPMYADAKLNVPENRPDDINVHPLLAWYKHNLETGHLSYDHFQKLMSKDHEEQLL